MKRVITLFAAVFIAAMSMQAASWPGKKGVWNDGKRYDFTVAGRNATVVVPQKALPGNPWVWRPAFFDAFDITRRWLPPFQTSHVLTVCRSLC